MFPFPPSSIYIALSPPLHSDVWIESFEKVVPRSLMKHAPAGNKVTEACTAGSSGPRTLPLYVTRKTGTYMIAIRGSILKHRPLTCSNLITTFFIVWPPLRSYVLGEPEYSVSAQGSSRIRHSHCFTLHSRFSRIKPNFHPPFFWQHLSRWCSNASSLRHSWRHNFVKRAYTFRFHWFKQSNLKLH